MILQYKNFQNLINKIISKLHLSGQNIELKIIVQKASKF